MKFKIITAISPLFATCAFIIPNTTSCGSNNGQTPVNPEDFRITT